MKENFSELVMDMKNNRDTGFRKQMSVFLICIVISLFIWMLINFSRTNELMIPYRVTYTGLPENLIMVNPVDSLLNLKLKANGFILFSIKYIKSKDRLYIDLQDLIIRKIGNVYMGKLHTGEIRDMLSGQLGYNSEIITASPDTLIFFFDEAVKKKLAVIPDIIVSYLKQYQLYGKIICIPDSVEAKLPRKHAKSINHINTEKKTLRDLDQNQRLRLKLLLPAAVDNIILSQKEVELFIPVEKYTENSMEIPITAIADKKMGIVKLFPSTVKVTYIIALKDFSKIDQSMFTAQVYVNEKMIREIRKLKIEMVQSPDNITITRLEPEKVEFILQK